MSCADVSRNQGDYISLLAYLFPHNIDVCKGASVSVLEYFNQYFAKNHRLTLGARMRIDMVVP